LLHFLQIILSGLFEKALVIGGQGGGPVVGSVLVDGSIGAGVGIEGVCGGRVDRVCSVRRDEINGDCRLGEGGSDGDLDWVDGGEGDEGEGAGGVPWRGYSRVAGVSYTEALL
jgi:hypothetical protein